MYSRPVLAAKALGSADRPAIDPGDGWPTSSAAKLSMASRSVLGVSRTIDLAVAAERIGAGLGHADIDLRLRQLLALLLRLVVVLPFLEGLVEIALGRQVA